MLGGLAYVFLTLSVLGGWSPRKLGLHAIITAERAQCYKPSFGIFDRARSEFGALASGWVHAAQSLHHDVGPARELGIPVVHVVRDSGRDSSAVPASGAVPNWQVPDLRALADAVERAAR